MSFVRYWGSKDFEVIKNLIELNSDEDDIVLDPFGGKGTTALAALALRRKAIYNDLNPFAHLVAKGLLLPVKVDSFTAAYENIASNLRRNLSFQNLYWTRCICGASVEIDRIVWSATYRRGDVKLTLRSGEKMSRIEWVATQICKLAKGREFTHHELMDRLGQDPKLKNVKRSVTTFALREILVRRGIFKCLGEEPQKIYYSARCVCNRRGRRASESDVWRSRDFGSDGSRNAWANGELRYKNGNLFFKRRNVDSLKELFTKRNLVAIGLLRSEIERAQASKDIENAFRLVLANLLFAASKMQRLGSGSWPVPCYWVPPTYIERNVFRLFHFRCKRFVNFKLKQLKERGQGAKPYEDPQIVFRQDDACRMKLRTNSIDYVLADPPQTDEIQYFELSYLTTAFLGLKLPFNRELVINPKRGKTEDLYWAKVKLALSEFVRIVKRGGRLTILLHGEDDQYFSRFNEIVHSFPLRIISSNFESYKFKNYFHSRDQARLNGDYYLTMVKDAPGSARPKYQPQSQRMLLN